MKNQNQRPPAKGSSSSSAKPRRDPASNQPPPDPPTAASNKPPSSPKPPSRTSPPPPSSHLPHHDPAGPPPPPTYGFHMLERRTIVLVDGSVRSYFALPPDYSMDPTPDRSFPFGGPVPGRPGFDRHLPDGFRGAEGPSSLKRKFDDDEFARHRLHVAQFGNPNGEYAGRRGSPSQRRGAEDERAAKHVKVGGEGYGDVAKKGGGSDGGVPVAVDVDPEQLRRAYVKYGKLISESAVQRKKYLEDGMGGKLSCAVCGRKEFADVHQLIVHAYTSSDSRVDHLGLHKALCVLMGWNYSKVPDDGKAYQSLSPKDAAANREDLIVWPPHVILHNTATGKRKDGRVDGLGNKEVDNWLREAGFGSGKAKSMYGKEGHLGSTLVKFADSKAGLRDAERLAEYLLKNNHGREGWATIQDSQFTHGSDGNLLLVKMDEKGEEKMILYGYLALATDLDKIEFDTRKKLFVRSKSEFDSSGK